ncbi:MAG: rhomboid family intramembrane serine protease [Gammaproteobacteria bacterium]
MMPRNARATFALIAAALLVYAAMHLLARDALLRQLLISAYTRPALPEIRGGQWWRLLTPMFLHFSLFHLVFNLLWVWELGRLIEARHGALALLGISAALGAASNLAQYFAAGPLFGGMSGLLYGYFGYLWIQGRFNPAFGIRLTPQVTVVLLGWFALCWSGVLQLAFNIHVANSAHSGGLLGGIALAFLAIVTARARHRFGRPA